MSQRPPFQQTINQTVNIRRRPGCLGGCAGIIGVVFLIAVIGAAAGGSKSSATPTPTGAATATIAGVLSTSVSVAPTSTATPPATATPTAAPQIVTVKDEAVNLRASADVASAVVMLVPPGTDALIIGEDTTGPDGVTRYVHVRVGEKEGYMRSDLVSAPHGTTNTPVAANPTPSASQAPRSPTGLEALSGCMYQGFGGGGDPRYASFWYGSIVGYRRVGTRIEVDTTLFFKDSNKQVAANMRSAVIGCILSERISGNWVAVHSVNNTGVLAGGAIPGR